MSNRRTHLSISLFVTVLLVTSSIACAQATRTWVSGVGDDANPCSRTAPCKTFAGAISKTAAGGEINALDPGGFGAVTITKSITIEAEGSIAGVLVSGTNAIIVNAGINDVVVLRGLDIEGLGTGLAGIRFLAGGALHVENCTINNFVNQGIDFEPSGASQLNVANTIVRNNVGAGGGGVLIKPSGVGSANVMFDHVLFDRNRFGMRAEANAKVSVRNCAAAGNTNNGFLAVTNGGAVTINLESTLVANSGTGIKSDGGASSVRLSNVTVTDNGTGLQVANGGTIASFGNNRIAGNSTDGAPNASIMPQ